MSRLTRLAVVLAAGGVVTQIMFPLLEEGVVLTVLAVVLLAGAAVAHAVATRGAGVAVGLVVVAGGAGLLAESVGVRTGLPFGSYSYAGTLGPQLLDVPLVVPLAWAMAAYPALLVARRLVGRSRWRVPLAAWALATWDVFLDPQMVAAGHWAWDHPTPALPLVPGIPLTNFAGWLLVSWLLCAALERVVPDRPAADDRLPHLLYLWTYLSSTMAAAVFFDRPGVALVGGLLMGTVGVPLLLRTLPRRRVLTADPGRLQAA